MSETGAPAEVNNNVFAELDFPNPEENLLKAQIVSHVGDLIRSKEMTQSQVAQLVGLTQPQVSNILRGRFRDVSIEKLLRIVNSLHHNVRIVISDTPTAAAATTVERELTAA